jgi:hypothetical protein
MALDQLGIAIRILHQQHVKWCGHLNILLLQNDAFGAKHHVHAPGVPIPFRLRGASQLLILTFASIEVFERNQ